MSTSGHVKKEFIACAREALANARYIAPDLQECLPWPFDSEENSDSHTQVLDAQFRVKWVKDNLAKNKIPLPVSFDYKTISSENKPAIGRHCVTVVAFDDEHERFIVINSWGFKSQTSYESVGYFDYDLAAAHPVGCLKPREKSPEPSNPDVELVH